MMCGSRNPTSLKMADVAGEDVARAQRRREGEPHEREPPHLCARAHALAGDARDVLGEMPVRPPRDLTARRAVGHQLVVEPRRERGHLGLAQLAGHGDEMPGVRPQLAAERDLADAAPVAPVAERAGEIQADGGRLHHAPRRRRPEQHARGQGRDDQEIDGRDRPVGGAVRDPYLVRGRPVRLRHAGLSRPRRAWPRWPARPRPCTAC